MAQAEFTDNKEVINSKPLNHHLEFQTENLRLEHLKQGHLLPELHQPERQLLLSHN